MAIFPFFCSNSILSLAVLSCGISAANVAVELVNKFNVTNARIGLKSNPKIGGIIPLGYENGPKE